MNIEEFFSLPTNAQEELVKIYARQGQVKRKIESTKAQIKELQDYIREIQLTGCTHPCKTSKHMCDEDEYGRRVPNSAYIVNSCPDCERIWTQDDA